MKFANFWLFWPIISFLSIIYLACPRQIIAITTTPVPSPTATAAPTPYPSLQLSEISACPTSGPEWIEIYNPSLIEAALSTWKLIDGQGTIAAFQTSQLIGGNAVLVVELTTNKLNNSGDSVGLVQPDGVIADSFVFSNCESDTTYSKIQNQWIVTSTNSKNEPNPIPITILPSPTPTSSTPSVGPPNSPTPKTIIASVQPLPTPQITQSKPNPELIWPTLPVSYPINNLRLLETTSLNLSPTISEIASDTTEEITESIPTASGALSSNQLSLGGISAILGAILWLITALIVAKNRS